MDTGIVEDAIFMQFHVSIKAVTMATEGADAMATQAVTATTLMKEGGGLNI